MVLEARIQVVRVFLLLHRHLVLIQTSCFVYLSGLPQSHLRLLYLMLFRKIIQRSSRPSTSARSRTLYFSSQADFVPAEAPDIFRRW